MDIQPYGIISQALAVPNFFIFRSAKQRLAVALLAACLFPTGAAIAADPMAEGFSAYREGDYTRAGRGLRKAADAGDGRAMNLLGEMNATGKGASKDPAQALAWFKSAAEKGDPDGENNLGELYAGGMGVAKDPAQAAAWFQKSARQGNARGSYNLGRLSVMGAGVPHDLDAAAVSFQQAVKAAPTEPRYRDWLGSVYSEQGRHADALAEFSAITMNGGKPADVWAYYQGLSLLRLGRLDEARAALTRARSEDPSHNRGVDRKTEVEARLKDIDTYDARHAAALDDIARGNFAAAKTALEAALAIADTTEVRERLSAVEARIKEEKSYRLLVSVSTLALALFTALVVFLRRRPRRGPLSAAELGSVRLAGRYQLQEEIGAGGMGMVYAAYDHERKLRVAAKRIRPELKNDPEAKQRFLDEAKAVSNLNHPNIVGVQAVVEYEGETIIVMDFIEGEPLSETLRRRTRLPLAECQAIMRQICPAVEFAHRNSLVHRDLKPSNIMIESGGRALVMDFGIARAIKDALSHMTTTAVVGTLVYMAPEQHLGKVCRQSDVYALGITLYEMLTGARPFVGLDPLAQKERLLYIKAAEVVPGLPQPVDELIAAALAPNPKNRPESVAAFMDILLRVE